MEAEKTPAPLEVEAVDKQHLQGQHGPALEMPASLAALSPSEYERIGKKATLKMDCIIMPIMVVMVGSQLST